MNDPGTLEQRIQHLESQVCALNGLIDQLGEAVRALTRLIEGAEADLDPEPGEFQPPE